MLAKSSKLKKAKAIFTIMTEENAVQTFVCSLRQSDISFVADMLNP